MSPCFPKQWFLQRSPLGAPVLQIGPGSPPSKVLIASMLA